MKKYWQLFITFARIGLFTIGGGYAMLPILDREVVQGHGWATEEDLLDYYAISQVLPGIIAINTAIFIGNKVKGRRGGVLAALGMAFPSLVIITLVAAFIQNLIHLPVVQHAFAGIRACVFVLIVNAILKLFKGAVVDWFSALLCVAVFVLSVVTDLNPILFVVACGALGLSFRQLQRKAGR